MGYRSLAIGHSHMVLIYLRRYDVIVVGGGVFQEKWDDDVWSKC